MAELAQQARTVHSITGLTLQKTLGTEEATPPVSTHMRILKAKKGAKTRKGGRKGGKGKAFARDGDACAMFVEND